MSTDDDDLPHAGPNPRLIVSNDDKALERLRAEEGLKQALREQAANLLRVVRGAGKPYDIGKDSLAVVDAFHAYRDSFGYWPDSYLISEALSVRGRTDWEQFPDEEEGEWARVKVIRAALQTVASRLVDQRTQETRAVNDLQEGIRQHEEWRQARNAKWQAERKAAEAKFASPPRQRKRLLKPRET